VTISIRNTLAIMPSGAFGDPLSFGELSDYLRRNCDTQAERDRNARHCLRDELYRDGGVEFMKEVIGKIFKDPDIQKLRQDWVPWARFNNPLKRIVNELSTVYAEPAKRFVDGDSNNHKYQDVLDAVSMDERQLQNSRLLNLHRALLVRFRVRALPSDLPPAVGPREPVLDWATPAIVRAVLHPNDPSLVVGWLIRVSHKPARDAVNKPVWMLWTDHERVSLRDDFGVIEESYLAHGLGLNPWVAVTLSPPGAGFWPGEEGEDLIAAAVAIWMQGVLLLKESKSATKLVTVRGDGVNTARGQAADSEGHVELQDGQSVDTLDLSMDLGLFRDSANHILEHVAQNYGMSAALINQQGVQSAEARELMRVPLRELRRHQQVPLRRFERLIAHVMTVVLDRDLPEKNFSDDGWRIEFGESQTPLSRTEEIDLFVKERTAGVDNTVDFIARRRPGMTDDQAQLQMERNIEVETARNELMRPLKEISGSPGADLEQQPTQEQEPVAP
jgi:hypothetical protein